MNKNVVFAVTAFIGCLHVAALDVAPCKDAAEFRRVGTLVPRSSPDPVDDQWMIGCEVLDRDFAKFSAYKDYLPQLGIRSIRLQGGWAKCEKEKGKYDFSWLDEPVNFALAHGMNPVLETDYGNPIYKGGGGHDLAAGFPHGEEGLAAWDRWVDALSRHFAGRVRDWLMWNEPDIGWNEPLKDDPDAVGRHKPDAIAAFNVRTARIIRKNIPDARIAGLSVCSTNPKLHEDCYKAFGKDIGLFWRFIYHGYEDAPEKSYANVEELQALCAKYAPHATLWQGENGAPSEMPGDGLALNHIAWSEISQAKWDMRRMLGDFVRKIPSSVFTICDYYHPGRGIGCYGLLRADSARNVIGVKRAFAAVRNVATVFDSELLRVERRVSSPENSLQLWEFQRRGAPLFVFWTTGEWMFEKGAWRMAYRRPGDSLEKRPAVIRWPGAPLEEPVWVDLLTGDVRAFPKTRMKVCADGLVFTDVPVYDSPCLITERRALDVAACAAAGAVIEVGPVEGNATPAVRAATERLKDGDTLRFAKGEYHFFEEGAKDHFLASVGSSTGMKKVVMHLEGKRNVTVDGNGASFVFHGDTFPFAVERCSGVKICNFTSRVFRLPLVEFTVVEKNEDGFLCRFAEGSASYETKDGEIFFDMDEGRTDSRAREISVHALRYCQIQYLTTPGCTCNKDTLASTFYPVAAEDRGGGNVFFRYCTDSHPKNAGKFSYPLNEPLCLLLGCGRTRSVMAFADCRDVEVADVAVRSGVAMGIVAEMCENIKIVRYNVRPDEGRHVSLTADAIFLVDTKGRIEIADSEICWGLDDVMNIHGNYTILRKVDGPRAEVAIPRFNYTGYFPYRVGEKVEFSRGKGPDKKILGQAVVVEFPKPGRDAERAALVFDRDIPAEWIGCDIANLSHAPSIWLHDNYFHDYMHNRLSAFADIVFERNRLRNGNVAILHDDLTGYWGECGPARTLVARDNVCEEMRGAAFTFPVPFSGRALLENNRFNGKGSGDPYRFGPGVEKTVEIR
ncbi:MAG: hypothetical protein IJI36_09740 [Kiritimatiellae bacterium]|nr:hypothetical protein [Kiritimatiellia bacterium]